MDYIVRDPVIVNGTARKRGDELTGDDAKAVEENPYLQARCVPHVYNEQQKAKAASAKPAPTPTAQKGSE